MEQILFGIDRVQISIDDVIVHAVTMEELINWLRKVFKRCHANNLSLNQSKCEFSVTKISVLGHVVSADGIKRKKVRSNKSQTTAKECIRS